MSESIKATRATIQLGSLTVDGFMLPDGSYRMSQTQAAECVGKPEINARRFLDSKAIKALLGQGYTPDSIEIESDPNQLRGQSRFNALPLEVVTAYWLSQAGEGEREENLATRIQRLERELKMLGDAYAIEDDVRMQRDYFERLLREHGIDPWEIPGDES